MYFKGESDRYVNVNSNVSVNSVSELCGEPHVPHSSSSDPVFKDIVVLVSITFKINNKKYITFVLDRK